MKNKLFKKQKKAIATVTIVLLLGFLSILSMTSILTYNAWRWDILDSNIKKDNFNNASNGIALMQFILLLRNRNTASFSTTVYDSYENAQANILTNVSVSSQDTLSNCNTLDMPASFDTYPIKRITAYNQYQNFYNNKTCCTSGIFVNSSTDELQIEEAINTYSKERCKNLSWPNLNDNEEPLLTTKIIQ